MSMSTTTASDLLRLSLPTDTLTLATDTLPVPTDTTTKTSDPIHPLSTYQRSVMIKRRSSYRI
ncbi:Hypothetical protein FKW44_016181 [Caligus rogercresseyi]|uniref:Uncharacterized protein n=1 Tax=Caligus rogercresseyi TaxID=217165 RepID=A0A7T8H235_CALRO|nr:Hypothetical protein FKW44_016181 [Caligus rogercresseyi]